MEKQSWTSVANPRNPGYKCNALTTTSVMSLLPPFHLFFPRPFPAKPLSKKKIKNQKLFFNKQESKNEKKERKENERKQNKTKT